jgi:hypothetical protein
MSRNGRAVIRLPAPYRTHCVVLKDSLLWARWDLGGTEGRTSGGKQDISSEGQVVTTYLHISLHIMLDLLIVACDSYSPRSSPHMTTVCLVFFVFCVVTQCMLVVPIFKGQTVFHCLTGVIDSPETSQNNYQHSHRNHPGERRSYLHRVGSLKLTAASHLIPRGRVAVDVFVFVSVVLSYQ